MNWTQRKKARRSMFHVLMVVCCFFMIYPILWMIAGSFKSAYDIAQNPSSLIPIEFTWQNYANGWRGFGTISFSTFFKNSIIITALSVVGQVGSSALIAYGFARCHFVGRKIWFAIMLITMMMPSQVLIIPQYIMFHGFGWINTWLPLIVPGYFGHAFFVFLIYQFIQGIPRSLDESAYIDGCSKYSIFFRIVLPLIKPALMTAMIFATYWTWDNYLGPTIYLTDMRKYTISQALKFFTDPTAVSDWGASYAMAVLSLVPVIAIFFAFQKYLVQGISTSGIKG